ncbi:hypothetical protein EYF80_003177 [Liparis tanakae]|uniref:Uncharacterized protein n=1 Tax=Liparis tanakae TaxID=230148 RepID=A0A4Z2J8R5_9TELE|nr:hypothetical protein EYF80_003177 [Liparis tanakae]
MNGCSACWPVDALGYLRLSDEFRLYRCLWNIGLQGMQGLGPCVPIQLQLYPRALATQRTDLGLLFSRDASRVNSTAITQNMHDS